MSEKRNVNANCRPTVSWSVERVNAHIVCITNTILTNKVTSFIHASLNNHLILRNET